jgi:hypothetical protein
LPEVKVQNFDQVTLSFRKVIECVFNSSQDFTPVCLTEKKEKLKLNGPDIKLDQLVMIERIGFDRVKRAGQMIMLNADRNLEDGLYLFLYVVVQTRTLVSDDSWNLDEKV